MTGKTVCSFAFLGALALAGITASYQEALATGMTACTVRENQVIVTLEAGPYEIADGLSGQEIDMAGFGDIMVPGAPMLPMKRFLIALPPGTRALSVEVLGSRTIELPGTYRIAPFPEIRLLSGMPRWDEAMRGVRNDWESTNKAIYLSDNPFPESHAWLSGGGTLRKYSYASVAFSPFTYYPETGRLEYRSEIEAAVICGPDKASGMDAESVEALMSDRKADKKASALFANYREVVNLYSVDEPAHAPLADTYDYVIITTGDLEHAITASGFPTWKTALGYRLRTVLTTDTEIASQPGDDLAERIRNFLRGHYATWGIEYVLLVGDYATVPMRICYPDPAFHVYDPSDPGLVAPGTPTDYYYADLSHPDALSWDSDGDGYPGEYGQDDPDFLAEVAVGRIPVNDSTRITYTLDKLVAFEQDTGSWKENVLHAGSILFFENQNYSGYPFVDGATLLDSMETGLMSGMTITHMSEQAGIVTSPFPWPPISETAFTGAWGGGEHAYVNWSGHGWSDGAYRTIWAWDDGDGVPEQSNGEMQSHRFIGIGASNMDDDHPSIVFAVSCNVGYPDPNPYGNLGIDLLTLPGWGSSAGIASSSRPAAVAGDWKATGGGTEQICYDFNRYMIVEEKKVGEALYYGKFYATTYYGWGHIYEYMNLYNYNLYGDPALAVAGATAGLANHISGGFPTSLHLTPCDPNPFKSTTRMRFSLCAGGRLSIAVYDVTGRRVAILADGDFSAGEHTIAWKGTGYSGERLASGLYFITVRSDSETAIRKVVLLK